DFGIAKVAGSSATATGVRVGTVAYMSPEQTRGEAVDARSDVWSFGVMLYEMLTGRRPFDGGEESVIVLAVRSEEPPPIRTTRPEVPKNLAAIIERCIQKEKQDRYADGRELLADLRAVAEQGPAATVSIARPARRRARRAIMATVGLVTIIGVSAFLLRLQRTAASPTNITDPRLVLVLPFTPTADDTTLSRLGRDLVITLSTNLDGLGELRTVDGVTVLSRAPAPNTRDVQQLGLALASELGAGRVIHGALVRTGDRVRCDITVLRTADGSAEARATASAETSDVSALTDSITWALLRQLEPSERVPASIPTTFSTRSLPALRAFLEGEQATAENRWRQAPDYFARAFELDSTFWLAYWRYAYAMGYRSRPMDPAITGIVREHRFELPERERALIEAAMGDSLSDRLARLRSVTERYPDFWRGWFALADNLIHSAMFAGTTVAEARAAIERATSLNPVSATHWQHLFWMAMADYDTAGAAVAIERLSELGHDSATMLEVGLDELLMFRYLQRLATRSVPDSALADTMTSHLLRYSGPLDLEVIFGEVASYTFHSGDIALAEATLRLPVPARAVAGAYRVIPQAWAGRGAWDSAMAGTRRYVARVSEPAALQHAFRLAIIGEWLGALAPGAEAEWRAALARAATQLDSRYRDELAWLDGVGAFARSDADGIAEARRRLASGDRRVAPFLDRSLSAFQLALQGKIAEAADSMVELERQRTERGAFRMGNWHPYLTAVNRLSAAEWLMKTNRAATAAPLLRWHDSVQFPAHLASRADALLRPIIHYRRGRVDEALGDMDAARSHYLWFLREYDRAGPSFEAYVDTARQAVEIES
ncbi:MAG: serine/threonine protein kinase, partial [Longimicrobiales bacterium]